MINCSQLRRLSAKPQPPAMGQMPVEGMTPGVVFERTGVDYAGTVYTKLGTLEIPLL